MPLATREAAAEGVATLVDRIRESCAEARYDHPLDAGCPKAGFLALPGDPPRGGIWIAHPEGAAAGWVVVIVRFSRAFGGRDAFIDDLFVRAEFRRPGVGKAASAAACDAHVGRVDRGPADEPAVAADG